MAINQAHKHICIVINNLKTGGAEKYAVSLANQSIQSGNTVTVIHGQPETIKTQISQGCQFYNIELHPGKSKSFTTYLLSLPKNLYALINFFKKNKPAVVFTLLAASAFPVWIACKLLGIKTYHIPMHASGIASSFERLLYKTGIAKKLDVHFIAVSNYLYQDITNTWQCPEHKIIRSSIGIDTSLYAQPQTGIKTKKEFLQIGIVARLSQEKEISLALKSLNYLIHKAKFKKVKLTIAGDGPEKDNLQSLCLALKIDEYVQFLGEVENTRSLYSDFDIYLQTTRNPNMGLSALEALSSGVPLLIAYRNPDEFAMAQDTLKNYPAGWIVPAQDVDLAEQIIKIYESSQSYDLARKSARTLAVTHYDNKRNLQQILQLVNSN